ncbi:type II toxin-antitoxin system VapC family toxin [Nibrella saemangeumensis]|uniref:Type II toxin-antitoxin system VapC family toxin n=1 Tax=Nibrella saemangeumensis TaxID=1084526 RepID=A0ABP8MXF8_9BACT
MDLLLDTHTFIWFLNGDNQLSPHLRSIISDPANRCLLSIASIWKIAIKSSLNKLELKGSFDQIAGFLNDNDIEILPITFEHLQHLVHLDFHHRDPFDRIMIAQAVAERIVLATKDEVFSK